MLAMCAIALVAGAQVRLSCGPAGRGRAAVDGARCECVAPLFVERVVAGVHRCVPTPAPARVVVRPRVERTCPAGEHRSDDHCCAAGHAWVRETSSCVCVDASACGAPAVATPAPTVPTAQMGGPVIVGAGWVPSGPYDEVASRMAQQARRFAAGFGVASDLVRATVQEGMEGVMVPGRIQSGYCFRIIAVGGAGVRALDLFIYDSAGRQVDADRSPEGDPIIGLSRPLCVPPGLGSQAAQLRVRSTSSAGPIAVQMFAQPFNGHAQ